MKNFKFISISIILTLLTGFDLVKAAKFKHKIKNLKAPYTDGKPLKGESVGVDISFTLQSSSGIEKNRIKVTLNGENKDLTNADFNIDYDNGEVIDGIEIADIDITISQMVFPKIENNLEVLYLVSALSTEPPLARKSVTKKASFNGNNDDSSGGDSDDGDGGGNGSSSSVTPELFRLEVEEVNGTGMVSETEKQFRIELHHDERILGKVTQNGFNMDSSPIFKNLKIISQNPNDKSDQTEIQDQFEFSLEGNGSVSSSEYSETISNELKTLYISNGKTITEWQNLIFKLNLKKFANKTEVDLEDNVIMKDKVTIEIGAEEVEFDSLSIADSSIDFDITDSKKKKYFFDSEEFNITGVFTSSENISSIRDVEYFEQQTKKKKSKPKIKNSEKPKKKIKVSGENGNSLSVSSSGASHTLTLPTILSLKSSISSLSKKGFYDSSIAKSLTIPVVAIVKTSNGLDLIVNGDITDIDKTLIFEAVGNGSSL